MTRGAKVLAAPGPRGGLRGALRWPRAGRRARGGVWPRDLATEKLGANAEMGDKEGASGGADAGLRDLTVHNDEGVFEPALVEIGDIAGATVFVEDGRVICAPESGAGAVSYLLGDDPTPFAGDAEIDRPREAQRRAFPSFTLAGGKSAALYIATRPSIDAVVVTSSSSP